MGKIGVSNPPAGFLRARALRFLFAVGKSVGTPCMPSHILVHPATTIQSAKSFCFLCSG